MEQIVVCICTYNRLEGLKNCLDGLSLQEGVNFSVIIVDNASSGNGLDFVSKISSQYSFDINAIHEPLRGIANARNAAVREARRMPISFLAFIDDDEIPKKDWLFQLQRRQIETGADVVGGPVIAVLPDSKNKSDELINADYYHQKKPLYKGSLIINSTANVLVRIATLNAEGDAPFDADFGLTGGSDMVLFWKLYQAGATMAWAEDAHVVEHVVDYRLNYQWLKQRSYRYGNINVRAQRIFERGWTSEINRILKTIGLILVSGTILVFSASKTRRRFNAKLDLARGLGKLSAHLGNYYNEYSLRKE